MAFVVRHCGSNVALRYDIRAILTGCISVPMHLRYFGKIVSPYAASTYAVILSKSFFVCFLAWTLYRSFRRRGHMPSGDGYPESWNTRDCESLKLGLRPRVLPYRLPYGNQGCQPRGRVESLADNRGIRPRLTGPCPRLAASRKGVRPDSAGYRP